MRASASSRKTPIRASSALNPAAESFGAGMAVAASSAAAAFEGDGLAVPQFDGVHVLDLTLKAVLSCKRSFGPTRFKTSWARRSMTPASCLR